jgi:hypothetical protein
LNEATLQTQMLIKPLCVTTQTYFRHHDHQRHFKEERDDNMKAELMKRHYKHTLWQSRFGTYELRKSHFLADKAAL